MIYPYVKCVTHFTKFDKHILLIPWTFPKWNMSFELYFVRYWLLQFIVKCNWHSVSYVKWFFIFSFQIAVKLAIPKQRNWIFCHVLNKLCVMTWWYLLTRQLKVDMFLLFVLPKWFVHKPLYSTVQKTYGWWWLLTNNRTMSIL